MSGNASGCHGAVGGLSCEEGVEGRDDVLLKPESGKYSSFIKDSKCSPTRTTETSLTKMTMAVNILCHRDPSKCQPGFCDVSHKPMTSMVGNFVTLKGFQPTVRIKQDLSR